MFTGKFCETKITLSKTDNINIFAKESLSSNKKNDENDLNLASLDRNLNSKIVHVFEKINEETFKNNKIVLNKTLLGELIKNDFNRSEYNNTSINMSFLELNKNDDRFDMIDNDKLNNNSLYDPISIKGIDEKLKSILGKPIEKEYIIYFFIFTFFLIILAVFIKK